MSHTEVPACAMQSCAPTQQLAGDRSTLEPAPREHGARPASPTVLVVDDEDGFRHLLGMLLSQRGYAVIEARDGNEAVARYLEDDIDVVLTDIFMPGKDGVDLIRTLRTLDPGSRIVAYSAAVGDGRGTCGPDIPLLAKPADFEEIEAALRRALGS